MYAPSLQASETDYRTAHIAGRSRKNWHRALRAAMRQIDEVTLDTCLVRDTQAGASRAPDYRAEVVKLECTRREGERRYVVVLRVTFFLLRGRLTS